MTSPDRAEDAAERGPRTYAPFTRLTASGSLGNLNGGVESWAINLSFARVAAPTQAMVDNAFANVGAFISGQGSRTHISCRLRQVKLSQIDAAGHLVGNALVHTGVVAGGFNSDVHPPQIALVVSLGTNSRGSQNRGRVYLPQPSVSVDPNTLTIPVADRDAVEGAFLIMLTNLAQTLGTRPVIASTKGHNTEISRVRVGLVLDTMRSRRRKVQEAYDSPGTVFA